MQTPSSGQPAAATAPAAVVQTPTAEPDFAEFAPVPAYAPELDVAAEPVVTTPDAPAAEPAQLSEMEEVALEMGWTPKDQWQGDPDKWTPAKDFVKRTGAILKNRTKQVSRQEKDFSERLDRMERTNQAVIGRLQKEHEAREAAIHASYEAAKKEAVKQGDLAEYEAIEQEQREREAAIAQEQEAQRLEQERNQPIDVTQQAQMILSQPEAVQFLKSNRWILKHTDDRAFQFATQKMFEAGQRGLGVADQMEYAERSLRYAFPEMYKASSGSQGEGAEPAQVVEDGQGRLRDARTGQFTRAEDQPNQNPPAQSQQPHRQPARMSAPARVPAQAQDQNFGLPPEALATAKRLVASGTFKDIKEYAAIYNGETTDVLA